MFAPDTYRARRADLAARLGGGLAFIPGNHHAPAFYPANAYPFRQDGTFRYYAGLNLPGLALTLDADTGEATLYGTDPTLEDTIWTGPQPTLAELAERAGLGRTAPVTALAEALAGAQTGGRTLHVLPPYRPEHTAPLAGKVAPSEALIRAVVAQREIKTDEEVAEMERALAVSAAMYQTAMGLTRPGMTERQIAGAVEGVALQQGRGLSFGMIASVHGEILHNEHPDGTLEDGQLFLLDSGALAPSGYASDITRTWPVNGRFSEPQRAIYETVLRAQEEAIARMRPGVPYRDVHLHAARVIAEGLTAIGLLRGDVDEAVAAGAHALFFPHGLGHHIGLDVHDLEGLGENYVGYGEGFARSDQFGLAYLRMARPLRAGHVITVEPGIYFIPALFEAWRAEKRHAAFIDYDAAAPFMGFGGVRIEDDVLVTEEGARVLGPGIPKAVADVEAAVGR
jgi:Xaa-Pro aminopeptidase